jgi:hypothetical protein
MGSGRRRFRPLSPQKGVLCRVSVHDAVVSCQVLNTRLLLAMFRHQTSTDKHIRHCALCYGLDVWHGMFLGVYDAVFALTPT